MSSRSTLPFHPQKLARTALVAISLPRVSGTRGLCASLGGVSGGRALEEDERVLCVQSVLWVKLQGRL